MNTVGFIFRNISGHPLHRRQELSGGQPLLFCCSARPGERFGNMCGDGRGVAAMGVIHLESSTQVVAANLPIEQPQS